MFKKLFIIFLLYACLVLLAGSFIQRENEWSFKQSQLAATQYAPDWYLIGSSRTRMGINSRLLGTVTNRFVYNLSCSNFFMPSNWVQLEDFLSQVSHKKFIVELSYNVSSPDYYTSFKSKSHYVEGYINSFLSGDTYENPYPFEVVKLLTRSAFRVTDFIPVEMQKQKLQKEFDQWGQSTNPIVDLPHSPTQNVPLKTLAKQLKANFEKSLMKGKPNSFYLQGLQNLIAQARLNQNEIYFYLPANLSETEARMLSCVWPYLPEQSKLCTYLDPQFSELFTGELLFDEGHLNKKGSQLLTQILIRQLQLKKVLDEYSPQSSLALRQAN